MNAVLTPSIDSRASAIVFNCRSASHRFTRHVLSTRVNSVSTIPREVRNLLNRNPWPHTFVEGQSS